MAPVPSGLFRPTSPAEAPAPNDVVEAVAPPEAEGEQGRGVTPPEAPATPGVRRRRGARVEGKTKGRKLNLPDPVFDRLQLLAIQRRSTVSAVAADILDRNLPRLRIERD